MKQDGSRAIREAISLAPENTQVKAAFAQIQVTDKVDQILALCEKFALGHDLVAGREALWCISNSCNLISSVTGKDCLNLLIERQLAPKNELQDSLVAALLQNSIGARTDLAGRLRDNVTEVFEKTYAIGDGSACEMAALVLNSTVWPIESLRQRAEQDIFRLFLGKLSESGHGHNGRAIKGIARLLVGDAEQLYLKIDENSFEAILACLDARLPSEVRTQATLATAKYLEVSKEQGQEYLTRFITTRIAIHKNGDSIVAFSAAAAVFPLVPAVAASLFLSEGFVQSLAVLLENETKSKMVEEAALEMLNAACIDGGCREAIVKHCLRWLYLVTKSGHDQARGQAAVVLAKAKGIGKFQEDLQGRKGPDQDVADIMPMFEAMLLEGRDTDRRNSIEGLAYSSLQPQIKEEIANNKRLLNRLTYVPVEHSRGRQQGSGPTAGDDPLAMPVSFGTLSILNNLTQYRPHLSEEQKRMSQLKAYANASDNALQPDPLDDDSHVDDRCWAVLDANAVPYMVNLEKVFKKKGLSPTTLSLMAHIILSLAKIPGHRGKLSQQSAIGLLRTIFENERVGLKDRLVAAHALARILISVDPKLAIHATKTPTESVISALLTLLEDQEAELSDRPRDLLPQFEGLLALTNMASDPTLDTGNRIVKAVFGKVEDLLLSNTLLIQRAATELICNLMTCPYGLEKVADGSKAASRRLHILLALADVEDVATRQAASGALAMLTEFETVVKAILGRDRGLKILLALCEDKDHGCVYRGIFCIRNIVLLDGAIGKKAREAVTAAGGIDILKRVLQSSRAKKNGMQDVIKCDMEALKALRE